MSRLEEIQARANQKPRGPWGTQAQEDIEWLLKKVDELMYEPYHNKYGLMGCEGASKGATFDRSQVKPFSIMLFSEEVGWSQLGVYNTKAEADVAKAKAIIEYGREVAIGDTNNILDLAHPKYDIEEDEEVDPQWLSKKS